MKRKILDMLKESRNEFVSGQYISDELGISREAVHKYMNQIKTKDTLWKQYQEKATDLFPFRIY